MSSPGDRAAVAAVVVILALAGVSYASVRPFQHPDGRADQTRAGVAKHAGHATGRRARTPRPRLIAHPKPETTSTRAVFVVAQRMRRVRFQCRLDGARWKACKRRVVYAALGLGDHRFSVRAIDRRAGRSQPVLFGWRIVPPDGISQHPRGVSELPPERFSIEQAAPLQPIYPGDPPAELPLTLSNPNDAPIYVTSLTVAVTASPPGCDAATNLGLTASSASIETPIEVPAGGTVSIPRPGASAPTIRLLDLPTSQDGCQGATFSLAFSGTAYG
jgi:hypothetical protein